MFTSAFSSGELKKLKSEIMKILIRGGGGGGGGGGVIGYLSCNFSFTNKILSFFYGVGCIVYMYSYPMTLVLPCSLMKLFSFT